MAGYSEVAPGAMYRFIIKPLSLPLSVACYWFLQVIGVK